MKKYIKLVLILLLGMSFSFPLSIIAEKTNDTDLVKVHFIDSGNSDSILIQINDHNLLLDAGGKDDDELILDYLIEHDVFELDFMILTHFHADHIGAADTVIRNLDVNFIFTNNSTHDTYTYADYVDAVFDTHTPTAVPLEKQSIFIDNTKITFYNTQGHFSKMNNNSLVVYLENGEDDFLFMGDAEYKAEKKIKISEVDLLKVGHHGSDSSTHDFFVERTMPEIAVITPGLYNPYGHPNQSVLDTLWKYNANIYRTDYQGTVIATSNGDGIIMDHHDYKKVEIIKK